MAETSGRKPFSRLPTSVVPRHYVVRVKPDLEKLTFTGSVEVTADVQHATEEFVCNAADLEVTEVKVNGVDAREVCLEKEEETMTVKCQPLAEGTTLKMSCRFVGELNDMLRGLYRSKYTVKGEDRFAAVTQFESTNARRCFPCWDEPTLKATFDMVVDTPRDRTILSNMPVKPESTKGDVEFQTSPKMSTYLVAIVIGEFEHVEMESSSGVKVRVYTPLGKAEQGRFALEASARSLSFYQDFFGIPYPLKKYDCVAIADFGCGAMENWGLVTFRETAVLVDPENSSAATRQRVAIVVTHEMAHQWFGNLVTMEWWTHLWLNEGFANFMENACTAALYPEFDIWTQFGANVLIPALELDALRNSHPIEVEVGHPSEVDEIFDDISYNKGASVIRMLHDYLGDEAFRRGMKVYLNKYAYGNTVTENLWECLEQESSGKRVGRIMSTWTGQKGFPVVSASRVSGEPGKLRLTQEMFAVDGAAVVPTPRWSIPVKVLTSSGTEQRFLLEDNAKTFVVDGLEAAASWFKVNAGLVGYYRVAYEDPDDVRRLMPSVENRSLSEVDRLGLLDDLFALAQAGKKGTVEALRLMSVFKAGEESYVVWAAVSSCLSKLRFILAHDPQMESCFKTFVLDLMSNVAKSVGWDKVEGEHHTRTFLRTIVLSRMGTMGHPATVQEAIRRFSDHVSGKAQIPADLRTAVYRTVAANGDSATFDRLLDLFRKAELQEEKERIAQSMGASRDQEVLKSVLEFALGDEVRSQDTPFVIGSVAVNVVGRDLAWEFFKSNFGTLTQRYPDGSMLMTSLIKRTTENFASLDHKADVERFFAENPSPSERTIRQSVESIDLNARWLQRDRESLQEFFSTPAS